MPPERVHSLPDEATPFHHPSQNEQAINYNFYSVQGQLSLYRRVRRSTAKSYTFFVLFHDKLKKL